jgi:hypothetical protein
MFNVFACPAKCKTSARPTCRLDLAIVVRELYPRIVVQEGLSGLRDAASSEEYVFYEGRDRVRSVTTLDCKYPVHM